MKLINLSKDGLTPVIARRIYSKKFGHYFYAVTHGEVGDKTCWQIRIPIPRSEVIPKSLEWDTTGHNFRLVELGKEDVRGNKTYMFERGKPDDTYIVLLRAAATDSVYVSGNATMMPCVGTGYTDKYQMFMLYGDAKIKVTRVGKICEGEPVEFGLAYIGGVIKSKRIFVVDEEEVVC